MRRTTLLLILIILIAACRTPNDVATVRPAMATAAPVSASADSLYKRLGGYDAIAAVTDDFIGRMIADKQLGRYFIGLSQNSREVLREHVIELLCFVAKGPCLYVGRDLGEAHTGLNITESDWQIALKHLGATMDKFHLPARERGELTAAIASFKEDIVGK